MSGSEVHAAVRADILDARLRPGDKLNTREICAAIGVSNGAVREALAQLATEGLVVAEAQRGYFVAPVSRAELLDLTRSRIQIERLCLEDSLTHGDLDWEGEVVAAFHRLSRVSAFDTPDDKAVSASWCAAHARFHAALVSACRSPILLGFRNDLFDRSERYRRLSIEAPQSTRDIAAEHKALMEACINRDITATLALISDHFEHTAQLLLDHTGWDDLTGKVSK
jgi:DNA-binding GntR family transcriptional regulator